MNTAKPTRIAQTSREARNAYKKNGPRISDHERRQLERAAELDRRAVRLREQEERRRIAKKKKEERERRERENRKQLGVGIATQMIGYSHTQAQLKRGMEAFVGLKKDKHGDNTKSKEVHRKLDAVVETLEKEPWDNCDDDDLGLDDLPDLAMVDAESLIDDDLDDEALLEAHDHFMSDAMDENTESQMETPPAVQPAAQSSPSKAVVEEEDKAFSRLHGPVNKVIEAALAGLQGPMVEFLSIDISTDLQKWNPPVSLLYKLNPEAVPPHRLRLKVGCVVTLLRDLNTSSQLSKSNHLQILRTEKDRLECLVLDGQLNVTKTFLTRVPFPAKYRNENKSPFSRTQFPVRVSTDFSAATKRPDTSQTTFKMPLKPVQPTRRQDSFKKPALPPPKVNRLAAPASDCKIVKKCAPLPTTAAMPRKLQTPAVPSLLDSWDDFLDSGTQIARELSFDTPSPRQTSVVPTAKVHLSTQCLGFSTDELEDLVLCQSNSSSGSRDSRTPSRRVNPGLATTSAKHEPRGSLLTQKPIPMGPPRRPVQRQAIRKPISSKTTIRKSPPQNQAVSKPIDSFHDFGLSTQDAASFFDDDEFSSPTVTA